MPPKVKGSRKADDDDDDDQKPKPSTTASSSSAPSIPGTKPGTGKSKLLASNPNERTAPAAASSSSSSSAIGRATVLTTSCIRYGSHPPTLTARRGEVGDTVTGTMPLGGAHINCHGTMEMARLQLLGSLSTCMLVFLEKGPVGFKASKTSGSESKAEMPRDVPKGENPNLATEIQMAYDTRGFYMASNGGAISLQTYMAMLEAIKNSTISDAQTNSESSLVRAVIRIKQLSALMQKGVDGFVKNFRDAADTSDWIALFDPRITKPKGVAKDIGTFLFGLLSGKGLHDVVDHENQDTWPNEGDAARAGITLHAELRILNAAWRVGTGDLFINGAKRACWGCSSVFKHLNRDAVRPTVLPASSSSSGLESPTLPVSLTPSLESSSSTTGSATSSTTVPSQATSSTTVVTHSTSQPYHPRQVFKIFRLLDDENELVGGFFPNSYCGLLEFESEEPPADARTLAGPARRKSIVYDRSGH
ncbi:hypothetical protein [Rugamonas rivuli]|uniref:Uncharacterized protein n=1 Tax=Rugamonas rivuli TaxID=2743358 RepID=A0A843SC43_9BURK|nr:hypothetical protein [Rugamonas rivuli]MQA22085.1 hypothetical protein [Rugamonas rivuli]